MTTPALRLIPELEYGRLEQQILTLTAQHPGQSGVFPLAEGTDAFLARLAMIDSADHSIDIQYYIYHPDKTGYILAGALLMAAERGVRVRVLLDDMYASKKDLAMTTLAQHINVEVRLFNPFAYRYFKGVQLLREVRRINRRMHNKSLTIDNQMTLVGGRNIGDEYFGADDTLSFGDFDVLAVGQVVNSVSEQFELYWHSNTVYPVTAFIKLQQSVAELKDNQQYLQQAFHRESKEEYSKALSQAAIVTNLTKATFDYHWGPARLLFDKPEKVTDAEDRMQEYMYDQLLAALSGIEKKLVLVSPYFVPGVDGTEQLLAFAARGVEVVVITNSLAATDVVAVHSGYRRYRKRLLEAGIELHEIKVDPKNKPGYWRGSRRASLHAKTFCADDKLVFVGSFNLDPRSVLSNTELGILIESEVMATTVFAGLNEKLIQDSYRVALNEKGELRWYDDSENKCFKHEPDASLRRRLVARLLGYVVREKWL